MSIKVLDLIPFPEYGSKTKLKQFSEDIKEIIDKNIEFCELIDFPYAKSVAIGDLSYKANKIAEEIFYRKTGRNIKNNGLFKFYKKKDEQGNIHFYVHFFVSVWEKALKGEENV